MKKFEKYEEKINNLLIKITDKIYVKLIKYVPVKLITYKQNLIAKRQKLEDDFKNYLKIKVDLFKEKVLKPALSFNYLEFIMSKKEIVLNYLKEKKTVVFTKEYWKDKLRLLKQILLGMWEKIKNFNFLFFFKILIGLGIAYVVVMFIHEEFLNYMEKLNEEREVRYMEDELGPGHPEYYKREFRTITFYQILMPVYDENNFVRTVLLTFTVLGSNSYIALYFKENEIEVRNHLVSRIRIMDTNFLFTMEGKKVIKDKVKFELNEFLKIKHIRGEIEEVYVNELLTD